MNFNHQVKIFKKLLNTSLYLSLSLFVFASPVFSFEIPSQSGKIRENTEGTNGKTIVLIEEAHVDYGAQKAIVEILRHLIETKDLRLLLVEGGWGNVSLSDLRDHGTSEKRLEVAERYLKEGKISAEEYLELTTEFPLTLWGLEDKGLYAQNMEAFFNLQSETETIKTRMEQLGKALSLLQDQMLSQKASGIMKKHTAYENQRISLVEYVQALEKASGGGLSEFPNLHQFFNFFGAESASDFEKVEFEKQQLVQQLSRRLTKPEFEELQILQKHKDLEGELNALESLIAAYEAQPELKQVLGISHLQYYAKALRESLALDSVKLIEEIEKLEDRVFSALPENKDEKRFFEILLSFRALNKLFQLQVTPEDFRKIEAVENFRLQDWKKSLEMWANQKGLTGMVVPEMTYLEKQMTAAKSFYHSARKRESGFIQNAFRKIEETNSGITAMIVGGFHSDPLAKAFKEEGYGVIRISPRFEVGDSETQHQHYLKILKYKWESRIGNEQNPVSPKSEAAVLSAAPNLKQ